MCYYNGIRVTRKMLLELLDREKIIEAMNRPMQSGFDYRDWPIIKPDVPGVDWDIVHAHWEYIPAFIKNHKELIEARKRYTWLNAKGENLIANEKGKPSVYKSGALYGRCLFLSSGFFEWRHYKPAGAKKDIAYPYYIHIPGREVFYIAGVSRKWVDQDSGETIDTAGIVTAPANGLMTLVHNTKKRMPTILSKENAERWLFEELTETQITELATHQYERNEMAAYTIRKDFRQLGDPTEAFEYEELPDLVL